MSFNSLIISNLPVPVFPFFFLFFFSFQSLFCLLVCYSLCLGTCVLLFYLLHVLITVLFVFMSLIAIMCAEFLLHVFFFLIIINMVNF